VIAALLSIVPTVEFRRWRPSLAQGQAPMVSDDSMRRLRLIVHLEMVAVVLILLCAALIARGIGIIH
jgi:putative membrane protein